METITVTQETGLGLLVSPATFDLTNAAQDIEIEVQKNVQYSITIDEACKSWISQKGTKALSSENVTFSVAANESDDNREGKITFKQTDGDLEQTVTVRQSQTNGLFITTPDYNLSNEAHNLSVEVKANVEFEVTSQAEWIKFVETKALTPSTITLSVEANESYDNRTGTVLVKQKNGDLTGTITINQKQTDYLTVTPSSFEVSNADETVTIEVKDNVEYSVVIPDDAKSWISVQSNTQTKALVDDQVVLAIAKNTTYDDRGASVTITQVDGALAGTISVKQKQTDGIIVDKTEYTISEEGGIIEIEVKSNVEFEVHANVDWIEQLETKALSSNTISMRISASDMFENRVGTITISQNSGSLSVNINVSQEAAKPKEITLNNAGELASLLGDKYLTIIGLKLNGNLNGSDFLLIRRMEKLKYLDLSEARIVAGGVDYYTFDQYQHYATADDVIGDYMFAYLPLEQMILPKVISKIGERAFYQSKLKTISPIPGNVELSEEIFMYCYSLTSIEFGEGISFFPTWLLGYCRNLVSISLPSTLKDLGPACLNGTALSSIVLPDGLMKIQSSALSSPNITELVIPQNVEFIGDWAFDTCSNLKEIHIKSMPSTLTYVGNKIADYNNVTVYIPKGTYSVYFLTNLGNFKNLIEE